MLSAVLTRPESVWRNAPQLARHLDGTVHMLTDLSPHIQEVDDFRTNLSDVLGDPDSRVVGAEKEASTGS
ncbi:hypothetical protein GCM10010360_29390 [Streptomyces nogalater]